MSRLLKIWQFSLFIFLVLFMWACAAPDIQVNTFYTIPTVTYLRECPSYDCAVVSEIYNSDKLTVLEKGPGGWWRVQADDQKIGWTQRELLSPAPTSAKTYYITMDGLPLRDSPAEDAVSRILLDYGEKVQKIAEQGGWWRIVVEKNKTMGWIPAGKASEEPPKEGGMKEAQPPGPEKARAVSAPVQPVSRPDTYFVAADTLKLHLIPSNSSAVVKVLKINDKVIKISQSGSGWFKVRYPETGAEGWAPVRYFKDVPVTDAAQIVGKKKKSRKKPPPQDTQIQDPFASEPLEPEGM